MKATYVFIFLYALFNANTGLKLDLSEIWKKFKDIYSKKYNVFEEPLRKQLWIENVEFVVNHNLQYDLNLHSFILGINEYADLSKAEYLSKLNGYSTRSYFGFDKPGLYFSSSNNATLPDALDWRDKGLVTPVKNQGLCGSCWAFSATGALEGQHKKKTGYLVSLSEQNLVDCSDPEGNMGCLGGWMDQAFSYVVDNKGLDTEKAYPYNGQTESCFFKRSAVGATCKGFTDIQKGNEAALQEAVVTVGPISVAIDCSGQAFRFYKGGLYNNPNCSSTLLNHGVLVIGYGVSEDQDYWLVKNSWGASWGERGYIRMSRNKNNQCGIASKASFPVV